MKKVFYTKTETLQALGIDRKTFERYYGLFKAGTHFIYKDPLNVGSSRFYDIEKVRKTVMQPPKTLTRLLK
tara:strand:+ start:50 stop:262 length:213 start_codon:yes stop_codon:yes gene_type:complete